MKEIISATLAVLIGITSAAGVIVIFLLALGPVSLKSPGSQPVSPCVCGQGWNDTCSLAPKPTSKPPSTETTK